MKNKLPKLTSKQVHCLNDLLRTSSELYLLEKLKDLDMSTRDAIINRSDKYPKIHNIIYGTAFPKSILEIGSRDAIFSFEKPLADEIEWNVQLLRKHKDKIRIFVHLRDKFETAMLLGEYTTAEEILEEVISKVGHSLWFYQSKFLIITLNKSHKEALAYLSELNEFRAEKKVQNLDSSILHYLCHRTNNQLSLKKYDSELNFFMKKNFSDFENNLMSYIKFKLNFFNEYLDSNLASVLVFGNMSCVIDRYLLLLRVITTAYIEDKSNAALLRYTEKIYDWAEDSVLSNILVFNGSKKIQYTSYIDETEITIDEEYIRGNYEKVISLARMKLNINPSSLHCLDLYLNSLILLQKDYEPIKSDSSPIDTIAKSIYNIKAGIELEVNNTELYRLHKNFNEFRLSPGILELGRRKSKDSFWGKYYDFSSGCFCENNLTLFNDKAKYLIFEALNKRFNDSIFVKRIFNKNKNEFVDYTTFSPLTKLSDSIDYFYSTGNFIQCELILKRYSHLIDCTMVEKELLLQKYAQVYLALNKYTQITDMYVDAYATDKNTVRLINTEDVVFLLKKEKYNIKKSINLVIFLILSEDNIISIAYLLEILCQIYQKRTPSELYRVNEVADDKHVELFYRLIIENDILKHSIDIKSTEELLTEYLNIATILENLESKDHNFYVNIKSEIENSLLVYKSSKKIQKSKIYVNQKAIYDYESSGLRATYSDMLKQLEQTDGLNYFFVDLYNIKNDVSKNDINPFATKDCHSFYNQLRNLYTLSKFGLDTYLSTRIRHGVLEGALRAAIDNQLLCYKVNGSYELPEELKTNYSFEYLTELKILKYLSDFTNQFNLIIQRFREEKLQINNEAHPEGLFIYNSNDRDVIVTLVLYFVISPSFEQMFIKVMDILDNQTAQCLINVRNYIDSTLKNELTVLFDRLHQNINDDKELQSARVSQTLSDTITESKTNTIKQLVEIKAWFTYDKTVFYDLKVKDLIKIALSECKHNTGYHCSQLKIVHPDEELNNTIIKENYVQHIIDLVQIFTTNMYKHGIGAPEFKYTVNIHNQLLLFFKNGLREETNKVKQNIQSIIDSDENKLQSEGGSGIQKAKKILVGDLNNANNNLSFSFDNNLITTKITINLNDITT